MEPHAGGQPSSEANAAYLRAMSARLPDLEGWRFRAQRLELPQRGSELDEDDKVFPYAPISEEARRSLVSSGEHLRLAWTAIDAGDLYPSAHFTTLRGALLAASQAVYILGPADPTVRRQRGLTVIAESYKRVQQYHAEFLKMPELPPEDDEKVGAHIDWLNGRRAEACKSGGRESGPNITNEVLPYAAGEVFSGSPDLQHAVMCLWRQMSGDAHSLSWALNLRASFSASAKGALLSEAQVGGSLKDIAEPFEAAYLILKRGWSLFDQRCEA